MVFTGTRIKLFPSHTKKGSPENTKMFFILNIVNFENIFTAPLCAKGIVQHKANCTVPSLPQAA